MTFLLALDQGTTSSRAIVFDAAGQAVASAQQEFRQHYPQPGWVEHDADEIWTTQRDCVRLALSRAGLAAADITALGIANQRETTVLWERASGRPLAPAIVWQDRRTAGHCDRLRAAGQADLIRARSGLELDAYFSATKLAWLLDHVPDARRRAEAGELAFGTLDSWLVWQLTGGTRHVTDPSNAARTMLFNLHSLAWDDTLLDLFAIPRADVPAKAALRFRGADGTEVSYSFAELFAARGLRAISTLDGPALRALSTYNWPGNVRELRNAIDFALTVGTGAVLTRFDLPPHVLRGAEPDVDSELDPPATGVPEQAPVTRPSSSASPTSAADSIPTLEESERELIQRALRVTGGNKLQAARRLGISRHRLYDSLRRFGLE